RSFVSGSMSLSELAEQVNLGRVGVVLFFCISGFVIPSSLFGRPVEGLRRFWIRPFFWLFPASLLSISGGVLTAWYLQTRPISAATVLANLTMIPRWLGKDMVIGGYWTLHVEFLFYVLCALLFAVGQLRSERVLLSMNLLCTGVFLTSLTARLL